jgi:hypothetical protein
MANTLQKNSKAQQVRNIIAAAKSNGQDQVSVIPAVMGLGFARQLARAYISNNWNRAEAAVLAAPVAAAPAAPAAKPARTLSMTPDAIRKREARARAALAREAEMA